MLALYSRKTTVGDGPSPIEAVELTSGWAESTSWADAPDAAPAPFASAVLTPGEGWKLFDVTPLVRKWASSESKGRGLMLRFAREDVGQGGKWSGYQFVSREGQADRRPMLLVVEPSRETGRSGDRPDRHRAAVDGVDRQAVARRGGPCR